MLGCDRPGPETSRQEQLALVSHAAQYMAYQSGRDLRCVFAQVSLILLARAGLCLAVFAEEVMEKGWKQVYFPLLRPKDYKD